MLTSFFVKKNTIFFVVEKSKLVECYGDKYDILIVVIIFINIGRVLLVVFVITNLKAIKINLVSSYMAN